MWFSPFSFILKIFKQKQKILLFLVVFGGSVVPLFLQEALEATMLPALCIPPVAPPSPFSCSFHVRHCSVLDSLTTSEASPPIREEMAPYTYTLGSGGGGVISYWCCYQWSISDRWMVWLVSTCWCFSLRRSNYNHKNMKQSHQSEVRHVVSLVVKTSLNYVCFYLLSWSWLWMQTYVLLNM